jgi:hypothetical protein
MIPVPDIAKRCVGALWGVVVTAPRPGASNERAPQAIPNLIGRFPLRQPCPTRLPTMCATMALAS